MSGIFTPITSSPYFQLATKLGSDLHRRVLARARLLDVAGRRAPRRHAVVLGARRVGLLGRGLGCLHGAHVRPRRRRRAASASSRSAPARPSSSARCAVCPNCFKPVEPDFLHLPVLHEEAQEALRELRQADQAALVGLPVLQDEADARRPGGGTRSAREASPRLGGHPRVVEPSSALRRHRRCNLVTEGARRARHHRAVCPTAARSPCRRVRPCSDVAASIGPRLARRGHRRAGRRRCWSI